MPTNTYVAIDTKTVTSAVANIEFTSVPQGYTDLVLVLNGTNTSSDQGIVTQVGNNSIDTGTNYSTTYVLGNGSSALSGRFSNDNYIVAGRMSETSSTSIIHYMNYSNTTTNKTVLGRGNDGAYAIQHVGMWRNTAAINTIRIFNLSSVNFAVGCTATLYGILAEGVSPAPKATGGVIYSDSTHYYHVFGSTGVFTPTQSITADVLVVAGGGGSGCYYAGGGGAGGFRVLTSQSLTTTNYTATIGAGGAGINEGSTNKGTNSSFASITATGGGAANQWAYNSGIGYAGGSGGGASLNFAVGGAGNQGGYTPSEGNNGGSGGKTGGNESTGGGGGAGGVGGNAGNGTTGGAGGIGNTATFNAWGLATGSGQNVNGVYYIAGGGGGGTNNTSSTPGAGGFGGGGTGGIGNGSGGGTVGSNGLPNTGGGAGGAAREAGIIGGSGGSGVVIVRYLKA